MGDWTRASRDASLLTVNMVSSLHSHPVCLPLSLFLFLFRASSDLSVCSLSSPALTLLTRLVLVNTRLIQSLDAYCHDTPTLSCDKSPSQKASKQAVSMNIVHWPGNARLINVSSPQSRYPVIAWQRSIPFDRRGLRSTSRLWWLRTP
jgi:hypothetical protein